MTQGNPQLATIAWRNLWRNRRRTLITVFGLIFGVFMAVLMTGIGDATYGQMINHAARMGGGHVVVQDHDYQNLPTLKQTVRDAQAIETMAMARPQVTTTTTRISGATMLATAKHSQGAMFMAIDPAQETRDTLAFLNDAQWEGEPLQTADQATAIVLGAGLAKNLSATLGTQIVYTVTNKAGDIVSGLVRVVGIVTTGGPSLDANLCVLPIDVMRQSLGYTEHEATMVAVYLADYRDAELVATTLATQLPAQATALTWAEAQPDLAGFIAMKEGGAVIFESIIMVLLAAGIFNTIFVSVMERLREFGIMAAIGFSPRQLFGLVVWESLWLAVVGLVGSAIVIAGPYSYLSTHGIDYRAMVGDGTEVAGVAMDPILHVRIYPQSLAVIVAAVVLATLVSGLYPAWRAGRSNPADAIRAM